MGPGLRRHRGNERILVTPDGQLMMNLVGNLGALGFIFWLVWRTTNHTIPRLAESFEKGITEQRKDHKEEMDRARADYLQALVQQRSDFCAQLERERQLLSDRSVEIATALKDLASEVRDG